MPSLTMSAQEARELLDLQPGYERADLSSAYRRVVRSVHPDLLVGSSEEEVRDASDRLAQVNMANELLQRALRINATEFATPPESPIFAGPSTPFAQPAPFAPAPSAGPAASMNPQQGPIGARRRPVWVVAAVVASVLVLGGFVAMLQLL